MATIDDMVSVPGLRLHGSRLFVASANDGVISGISMVEGTILHQWATGAAGVRSLDVIDTVAVRSPFANPEVAWRSGLECVGRASGRVDIIRTDLGSSPWLVRVSPGRPGEVYVGSNSSASRFVVSGVEATRIVGGSATIGLQLEASNEGEMSGGWQLW